MDCQECHQRPASLHLTKIINGKKTEMHLCEKCAKEKGEILSGGNSFSINDLLSGLLNIDHSYNDSANSFSQTKPLQCENCGLTYTDFTRIGRFGCGKCYKTFNDKLDPILKRVHSGNTVHAGKIPKRIGGSIHTMRKIKEYKTLMKQAISDEEFEKAAEFRDQIRAFQKEIGNEREGEG
jgi:protein arginine kinase activator